MSRAKPPDLGLTRPFPEDFMRNIEHNLRRRARLEREAAELERKKAAQ